MNDDQARDHRTLDALMAAASRLGIPVRREVLGSVDDRPIRGGLCRIADEPVIYVNTTLPLQEQIQILVEALAPIATDGVFLLPAARELLDAWSDVRRDRGKV